MDRFDRLWRRGHSLLFGNDYDREDGRCRLGPEWLVLVINNFCNLRCKMCDVGLGESNTVFYDHLIGDDPQNMSLDLMETILTQAADFFPKPKIGLAYTEPLLHRQILDFCRVIVGRGFVCSITTNGFMLPRLADDLVAIGVNEVIVSVDGPQPVHDRIRGHDSSFHNLYLGAKRLNAAKERDGRPRPELRFSYTLTDENYTHMVDFVHAIEGLNPAGINFSHLNFIAEEMAVAHNAQVDSELAMSRSNLGTMNLDAIDLDEMWQGVQALKQLAASRPDLPPITIVPDFDDPAGLETFYHQPTTFVGGRNCTDPWRMTMIRSDGTVIPAHGRCYNVPIGNVTVTPLPALWNNQRFRAFRQTLQAAGGTLPACARCCGVIGK